MIWALGTRGRGQSGPALGILAVSLEEGCPQHSSQPGPDPVVLCCSQALALPDQLYDAVFDGAEVTSKTPIRLYGGALLSEYFWADGGRVGRPSWPQGITWTLGDPDTASLHSQAGWQPGSLHL